MRAQLGIGEAALGASRRADTIGEDWLERYRSYRRRQAMRLIHMLPKGAVRPLYRRARDYAQRVGIPATELSDDPLGVLVGFCQMLLPLPPFDVWLTDVEIHPGAYFLDMADSVDQPTPEAPATVESRLFACGGRSWTAHLRSYQDSGLWRGYIAFTGDGDPRVHRTAPVFCEQDPSELRERFLSFEPAALQAFLRSALP